MSERITRLVRTNIALVLLCVISIGVLFILARGPGRSGAGNPSESLLSPGVVDPMADALAHSPLKDMPVPSHFRHFTYTEGGKLSLQGDCQDIYKVTMIFPAMVDYRIDPLSARYNTATQCDSSGPYSEVFILDSAHLVSDEEYYVITASEGERGIWHDPR